MATYYEMLGISPQAGEEEIKAAYQELAKQYHPDKYRGNPLTHLAEERMKEINAAYDVLKDKAKRARYDQWLQRQHITSEPVQHAGRQGIVCHRHQSEPAVAICQFCGKGLCSSCAAAFTIVACPECLKANNERYFEQIKKPLYRDGIAAAVAVAIALMGGAPILVIWLLGIYWGWSWFGPATFSTGLLGAAIGGSAGFAGALFFMLLLGRHSDRCWNSGRITQPCTPDVLRRQTAGTSRKPAMVDQKKKPGGTQKKIKKQRGQATAQTVTCPFFCPTISKRISKIINKFILFAILKC
nr:J domain-containing protein [Syntrophothermus sp.]